MKILLTVALVLTASSVQAQAQTLPIPDQVQPKIAENYYKGQAERLRQEQMRLENERLRQEIERERREAAWRTQQDQGQQKTLSPYEKSKMSRLQQGQAQSENEGLAQNSELQSNQHDQEGLRLESEEINTTALASDSIKNEQSDDAQIFETLDQLQKLGDLRNDGILTEEEYENLKKRILQTN